MKERGRISHTDKIPKWHEIGSPPDCPEWDVIEDLHGGVQKPTDRGSYEERSWSLRFLRFNRRSGEKAMFTAACAMFTMFSLTYHCSVNTNISTRKTTIVRGNLKTFPKQEKEKCKCISLFLMFQHAVNFFGGVYLCPNTPCLPVCGANG